MFGAGGVSGNKGQIDVGVSDAGQVDFRFFSGFFQALHGHAVVAQVDAVFLLEFISHPVDDPLVEVVAAQVVVAGGSQNFLNALAHFNNGNVEGAAAQVVNHNLLVAFFVHAVSQGSRGRLIDDALYIQARNASGVLGSLTLGVGKVSGNGDNRFGDSFAQVSLGVGFQFLQDHSRNFLRGVSFAVNIYLVIGAHVAFNGADGPVRVGDSLAFCHLAHHTLAVFGEGHNGRSGAGAFMVCNNNRLAAFHNGYAGVCRTKVDTNDFSHK